MKVEESHGKLVIVDFNELEAYKIAVKIEQDGIEFYKKFFAKNISTKAKHALGFLLEEETKHIKFFEDSLALMRQIKEDSFEEDNLLKTMDYGIFWPYQEMKDLDKILNNPEKALKLGFVIEDRSINFYESCKENIKDEETTKELEAIITEEKKHRKLIQDLMDSLSLT